jgi:drug/metabolite transporter (DMT)-like permease
VEVLDIFDDLKFMQNSQKGYPLSAWIILFILALTWGSSFILMKRGLVVFSSFQLGALRISLAFLCLAGFGIPAILKMKRHQLLPVLTVGILGNGLPAFLFATAQTKLESSQAGILNGLAPFFTFIVGVLFFGMKASVRSGMGILLGFAGAAGLVISKTGLSLNMDLGYSMLLVIATFFYGISANTIRYKCRDIRAIDISAMAFSFIGIPAIALLFSLGFVKTLQTAPGAWEALGYVVILAVCGTAFAVVLFNKLLKDTSALFGSSVTYLMPVVAVLWGAMDGEELKWIQLLYAFLILAGIYLVNYQPKKLDK